MHQGERDQQIWDLHRINRKPKMDSTKPLAKANDRVYEVIDPTMEWVREAGFDTLLVNLTGVHSLKKCYRILVICSCSCDLVTRLSRQ